MGRPAVFLDRDGTLIEDRHYLSDPKGVVILPGVAEGLVRLAAAGFALVVITNQSGVARGFFDESSVRTVNAEIEAQLGKRGVKLDAILVCPHLDEGGAVPAYSLACDCRKPKLGLFRRAAEELDLDLKRSWAIGDTPRDVERVHELGARGVLLASRAITTPPWVAQAQSFAEAIALVLAPG